MTSDKKDKNKFISYLKYAAPFILTGLLLYFAFKDVDVAQSLSLISQASILWLVIFIVTFFISHYLRALRWKVMIRSVKEDTSLLNLFGAVMIGYGVNCVVPRLGEVYRGLFLGRWENLSRTSMLGTIIIERFIDIFVLILSCVVSVFIYSGDLYVDVPWLKETLIIGFGLLFIVLLLLVFLVRKKEIFLKLTGMIFGKISTKVAEKISYILEMLTEGFSSIRGFKNYSFTIILSVVIMLVYALNAYFGFYILGMDKMQNVTFAMAWVLMTIGAFGVVIPTPGGTGSYHIIAISVLTGLYAFNIEISAAYAILTQFISYVSFIASALFFIYFINKRRSVKGASRENFFSVFKMNTDMK